MNSDHKLEELASRIRVALGSMPYGSMARFDLASLRPGNSGGALGLLEAVARAIESLRSLLEAVASDQQHQMEELQELRDAVAAYGTLQRLAQRLSEP